jgi:hypothetical protein
MKKTLIAFILIFALASIYAHPPADIKLSYDKESKILSVTVIHNIKTSKIPDPNKHFIKKIALNVNGNELIVESISAQQSDEGEKSAYLLNVSQGDRISVSAACSLSGNKTAELQIEE